LVLQASAMIAARIQQLAGARRNFLLLLLACIATFFAVIFFGRGQPTAPAPVAETPASRTEVEAPRLPVAAPARIDVPPVEPQAPPAAVETYEQPTAIASAADADERAAAIRELDEGAPEAFGALVQVVRNDAVSRNRLLALNSLRLMGKRAADRERVAAFLQSAMTDSDPNVAASARAAYQELGQ
jgi:hypothetical protein